MKIIPSRLNLRALRAGRMVLRMFFRFDAWHLIPLQERKYAQDIIRHLNARPENQRNTVVEIGCGLGDILYHLNYQTIKGYDRDVHVLRAARFMTKMCAKKIQFKAFDFPEAPLKECYNAILMVNWIHHIHPDILKNKITTYFNMNLYDEGEIIVDTVQDKEYRFNHSIEDLTEKIQCKIIKIGDYERQRAIYSLAKGNAG